MGDEGETGAGEAFPRPRVVLSRCLELAACRYNGERIRSAVVRRLEPHVDLVPVCPEVEVGLGVPRPPIRLVVGRGTGSGGAAEGVNVAPRLVQPSTGRDLTDGMRAWAHGFADAQADVDGVILKSRSPSCGIGDVNLFADADQETPVDRTTGAFARVVLERWPEAAVEDEVRLTDPARWHHFLTRIHATARMREAVGQGRAALTRFHTAYKLVLMAHSPTAQRELGRMLAEAEDEPFDALARAYGDRFRATLAEPASVGGHVNAIQHAQGYVKEQLSGAEKARFEEQLGEYRADRQPLQAILAVVGGWAAEFGVEYLLGQAYLLPYPRAISAGTAPR